MTRTQSAFTDPPRRTEVADVARELALDRALWWIDRPRDSSAWLWVGGKEGAGKTGLLREIAGRQTDALFLDCAGKQAEDIARELADSLGVAALDTYGVNFAEAVTRITTGPVVILANTQWAGGLRTTREQECLLHDVVQTLIRNHPRHVRMRLLVEVDDTAGVLASLGGRELTLRGPAEHDAHPSDSASADSPVEATAFRALALAESRTVPLPVCALLCSALGHDISVGQLASSHAADVLTRTSGDVSWSSVAFRRESRARAWRETVPHEETERFHAQAMSRLRSAEPTPAIDWYVRHAVAGHAAAAGAFESLLHDAATLARVGYHSMFEAFEAAYHDRAVPQASLAANLHYLAERGVWPSTQGEWLALLHLSLLDRSPSDQALAEQLLAAAVPFTLPWHTMWAHGTGPGIATTDHLIRRPTVRRLDIAQGASGAVAVATDGQGDSTAWALDSGEPAITPDSSTPSAPGSVAADQGLRGWRPAGAAEGRVDLPRMPRYVRRAVRAGDSAVLSSSDGVFAIAIRSPQPTAPSGVLKRMVRTATRLGPAAFPAETLRPSAEWFANVWGTSALKRVAEDALPSGLSDAGARQFLSEVGLPHVSGFLELETLDLAATGLSTLPDSPVPVDEGTGFDQGPGFDQRPRSGQGPMFVLGSWQGAALLLDGTSGKVLQDGTSGIGDPLAGNSLRQFITMARLYYWWFASDWTVEDAETDLRAWLARIDPDAYAYATEGWQRVFEDYDFTDRL